MTQTTALARARATAAGGQARAIRLAARVSQAELAAELGCSRASVSRWETGQRAPRGRAAGRYLRLLQRLARTVEGDVE
jgi:DNA-binding transcriptional regulator YiaG